MSFHDRKDDLRYALRRGQIRRRLEKHREERVHEQVFGDQDELTLRLSTVSTSTVALGVAGIVAAAVGFVGPAASSPEPTPTPTPTASPTTTRTPTPAVPSFSPLPSPSPTPSATATAPAPTTAAPTTRAPEPTTPTRTTRPTPRPTRTPTPTQPPDDGGLLDGILTGG